jgi:tetratricopeptide (TPR) repeat protein
MNPIKLTCPACGGSLEIPGDLSVAHCIYCGSKILLDQEAPREKRQLQHYLELCEVAVKAGNHAEAIGYCNQILEVDPKNIDAWVNKAISTFWLTTAASNRYNEAIQYLDKASEIAPGDERIATARKTLADKQASWLRHLGLEQFKHYLDWRKLPGRAAAKYLLNAMNYYLSASDYAPDSIPILEDIECVVKEMAAPSTRVQAKLSTLAPLRARARAQTKLPQLTAEVQAAALELTALRTRTGLLAGAKTKLLELKIHSLRSATALAEKEAAYEPPKA